MRPWGGCLREGWGASHGGTLFGINEIKGLGDAISCVVNERRKNEGWKGSLGWGNLRVTESEFVRWPGLRMTAPRP
jgi:hypothetical protein